MQIVRFSAVETFGAPIDNPEVVTSPAKIAKHMRQYSAAEKEVSSDLIDITPYYFPEDSMKYFLFRRGPNGPAVVEMMKQSDDKPIVALSKSQEGVGFTRQLAPSTIEIPGISPAFAIVGQGPRFAGQLCIHEYIVREDIIER